MKTIEKILLIAVIVLLFAGFYIAIRNIDFFNVQEVDVSVSGPVTFVSVEMQRLINPLKGRNIFEIGVGRLKKTLAAFDGVRAVSIKRFYPNKLIIKVDYEDITLKAYSIQETSTNNTSGQAQISYYFIHNSAQMGESQQSQIVLEQVGEATWQAFDKLEVVELNPAYAQMMMKWGCDQGFKAMVNLAEHLTNNNLITSMKYDNNNGNEFGRLAIGISSLNSTLYVRDLVDAERLDEALEIISNQFSAGGATVVYDLYANTLVKRT